MKEESLTPDTAVEDAPLPESIKAEARYYHQKPLKTLKDLTTMRPSEILAIRAVGRKTLDHVREVLKSAGLYLRGDSPEDHERQEREWKQWEQERKREKERREAWKAEAPRRKVEGLVRRVESLTRLLKDAKRRLKAARRALG